MQQLAGARRVLAAAPALPYTTGELRQAFDANPSDPVPAGDLVAALRPLLRDNPEWSGSAASLARLLPLAANPQALSRQLRTHQAALASAKIGLEFHRRHGGARIIRLRLNASPAAPLPRSILERHSG